MTRSGHAPLNLALLVLARHPAPSVSGGICCSFVSRAIGSARAMKPTGAETLNGTPVRLSPKTPPMTAIGMTLMVNSVSTNDPKLIGALRTSGDERHDLSCVRPAQR